MDHRGEVLPFITPTAALEVRWMCCGGSFIVDKAAGVWSWRSVPTQYSVVNFTYSHSAMLPQRQLYYYCLGTQTSTMEQQREAHSLPGHIKVCTALPSHTLQLDIGCALVRPRLLEGYKHWYATEFYSKPLWPSCFASWTGVRPIWRRRTELCNYGRGKSYSFTERIGGSPSGSSFTQRSGFHQADQVFTQWIKVSPKESRFHLRNQGFT